MNKQLLQSIIDSDELGLLELKPFKNHSIFQGWNQYFDDSGIEWRVEKGSHSNKFYKNIGNAFMYDGFNLTLNKRESIEKCHYRYLDQQA